MLIATTYSNGEIFQHFGHSEQFKLYEVEDGNIVKTEVMSSNGSGHGALAGLLKMFGVEVLICGGIGGGAQTALANEGIKIFGGVKGNSDEAVDAYLNGTLEFNPNIKCNHHGEGHNCGEHSCGGSCGNH